MKQFLVSFCLAVLFGLGLGLSGMTNPHKVQNFLDIFGSWDPSLLFVMLGAIGVNLVLFHFILKRRKPVLSNDWRISSKKELDRGLIVGSFLFGIGWGLAGFCPGPAVVSLSFFKPEVFVFFLAMILGMFLFQLVGKRANS
jgi:uncharacterized protein